MCLRLIIGQQQERWKDKKNDHCSVLCGEERCKKKTNENIDDTQHSGRFNVLHLTKKNLSWVYLFIYSLGNDSTVCSDSSCNFFAQLVIVVVSVFCCCCCCLGFIHECESEGANKDPRGGMKWDNLFLMFSHDGFSTHNSCHWKSIYWRFIIFASAIVDARMESTLLGRR